ncbi:MAG: hypothetical protein H7331_06235, partial [Bacteroidia bacterium]|nr:hypothetical protein [Bacteroidia bacterium]
MKKITSNSFTKQNTINKKIIKLITFVVLLLTSLNTYSQNNVGIGTTTPNSKAILELQATDKGFIAPRMTGAQMLAIPVTAVESALLIYNTDSSCYHFYNGMAWKNLCNNNLDTALINKAIKNYLSSNSTTIINILKGDTALFNYVTINNANINTLTVDTNITNVAIINSADIKILKVDSSVTNYAEIKNLQGGWASMDSLKIGGKNIMTTISDSIAAQAWLLKGNNTTATNKLGTLNAQDLHIVANNVEAITINNGTRNVGISQPLPAEKLDVTGNIKFTGALKPAGLAGNANEVLSSTGASTAPIWQPMSAILNSTITTNMNVVKIDSSAINYADINILKGDSANLNYLSVGGQNIMQTMTDSIASQAWLLKGNIGTNPNSNFIGTIDNKSLRFRTKNTEKMIIDSLGIVGLGISTPLSKLHIVGIGTSLYNNGLTVQSPNAIQSLDVLPGFALTNSTPSGIQEDITMTLRSSGSLFGNMAFATGNEERMRLTTIGRFGIGTSIPNAKLSLETFGNDGFTMGQNIGATPNGGDFSIYSTGASNPGYGQFIQSNWQYVSALNQYAKAGGASRITMINADYIGFQNIGNVNAGDIILQTAPAGVAGASIPYVNTLALKATGNVGIGTVNPINRLNVTADGTIKPVYDSNEQFQFHGNAQMYGTVSSDFQTFGFGVNGPAGSIISTHGAWIGSLTNDRLNFRTNNVEQMVITNLGNVGIGTTSPAAKLDVRGNILAVNGGLFSSVASTNGIQGLVELKGSYSTSSRPNLNSWTLYNMNEYGGVESGLSIWEYYDVDNNGSYCNPGDI